MEVSTNNCCRFMAIFIVFPGFCLKQSQQLFSGSSYAIYETRSAA